MGDRQAKDALFEQFARVGKALSSPKRLELIDLLAQGERTVESLARAADLGLTTCSAHLQTLKRANVVATRRDGTKIYYRLAGPDVAAMFARLRDVATAHSADAVSARNAYLGEPDTQAIQRDELLRRLAAGDVLIVDVRPAEEYDAGHIPGAIGVPLDQLSTRLADLPHETQIVAYCRGAYCVLAHDAVRLLTAHGRSATRLADGMLEWRLANLPIETTSAA
jgi:rhodanese-related sulfurtransferase/DNA-binding transcriptional ArsR family regulator